MVSSGLKRKTVRRPNGTRPPEIIRPKKAKRPFSNTTDYKYFNGHVTRDIAKQLPDSPVFCWNDERPYDLNLCAVFKFWQERPHCKRCPLFQNDEHTPVLRDLITAWETDELIGDDKNGD